MFGIIILLLCSSHPAHAVPFGVRIITQPPTDLSSASAFTVQAELYDQATNQRYTVSGVTVTLDLLRCPGYPSSCTPTVVTSGFATTATFLGVATFSNLRISNANTDYYFVVRATGYISGSSAVVDVAQATVQYTVEPPTSSSPASRFPVQAVIRIGPAMEAPIDTRADNIAFRLALYRCPGYPSACSVVIVNTNFANTTMNNGVATFNSLNIDSAAEDYYFYTVSPSTSGITHSTSPVFDVGSAVVVYSHQPPSVATPTSTFNVQTEIHVGTAGGPVDTLADSLAFRLALYRCPGYPNSCSVIIVDTDFANATMNNGVATFNSLNIGPIADDYYFYTASPSATGITHSTSIVFDVRDAIFIDGFESGDTTTWPMVITDGFESGNAAIWSEVVSGLH